MLEIFLSKRLKPQVYREILSLWSPESLEIVRVHIRKSFPKSWKVDLQQKTQELILSISNRCTAIQMAQSSQLVRDFCWSATHPKTSAVGFCRNANILSVSKKDRENFFPIRISIQGGHRLSSVEYEFVKKIGIFLGKNDVQIITGSGNGAMKASMEGGILGYWENAHFGKRQHLIGLTQQSILQLEFPNEHSNELIVFPTMEQRLEAFYRLSDAIFITVGGVGTIEEIILLTLLQLKNFQFPIPYYFVCSVEQQEFFHKIFSFLTEFSPQESLWTEKIYCVQNDEDFQIFLDTVLQTVQDARIKQRQHCNRLGVSWKPYWNKFLKFPSTTNREISTKIVLERDKNPQKSLLSAYHFFAQIVRHTITPLENTEKLLLQGEQHLIVRAMELLQFLQRQGKLNFDILQIIDG